MTAALARPEVRNFSGEIRFRPAHRYQPATEEEVLAILDRHAGETIRVAGARHSWNEGMVSRDVLLDLRRLDAVTTTRDPDGTVWATAGGGCRLKHLLRALKRQAGATLPSMGLITEQTIAGAISTGTHGSGRHSLSHYMAEVRVAAYDPESGRAVVHHFTGGEDLRAARCAVGCMGIVLSVRFRCPPRYLIAESLRRLGGIDEALEQETATPLQQFYLIPHLWGWYNQARHAVTDPGARPSQLAPLYRLYWLALLDVGFHLVLKLLLAVPPGTAPVRWFYRRCFPWFVVRAAPVVDWNERQLVMEHELFRHQEIELFVPRSRVREAAAFVEEALRVAAGSSPVPADVRGRLPEHLATDLDRLAGRYTHHYPICFRRVLPDDTLISMASDPDEPWYAISFITYREPREPFLATADFLARSMAALFGARPHWGKYYPPGLGPADHLYPEADRFRARCRRVDPHGVFRNPFLTMALGFGPEDHRPPGGDGGT